MRSAAALFVVLGALVVLVALGGAAGCGGSGDRHDAASSTSSGPADHNADDIAFARNMIPHSEQAVQMAQMVPTNTTNPQVIALGNLIADLEVPWIQAFRNFLMQWQNTGHDAGQDIPMAGMADATTMNRLQTLHGPDFDRLWLTSMIDHHRGSVAMAQQEVAHGRNPDVIYLAKSIISTQQPEIDQMNRMLGG